MAVALPFFAITLFVSAFLLFLVQPMIGKMILPKLGGTPQVWNTCMVFFQTALLAGYFYTHAVSTRLSLRRQLLVHSIILLVPLAILLPPGGPFNITSWVPPPGANPIPSTLLLLTVVVGVPFFVVATSAPLLQKWFAYTGHPAARDPYFLYGASNLGSMLALLAYPVVVEPIFRLSSIGFDPGTQNWVWTIGYILLVGLVWGCAFLVTRGPADAQLGINPVVEPPPAEIPPVPPPQPATEVRAGPPPATSAARSTGIRKGSKQRGRSTAPSRPAAALAPSGLTAPAAPPRPYELHIWRRLRWIGLAAVPSSMMLGVTTYMSTDISAIPFFWVIPLALYLLSFILVFMRWPITWIRQPHTLVAIVQPVLLLGLAWVLATGAVSPIWRSTLISICAFFATALVCHGELARDRPPTKYLTEFYLWMSVGGMLGGVFNALLAPLLFPGAWEFSIAVFAAAILRPDIRSLVPLEKPLALGAGAILGVLVGWVIGVSLASTLAVRLLWAVLLGGLGALFGAMYEPAEKTEGWTDGWIAFLFPGLARGLADRGDAMARNYRQAKVGDRPLSSADLPSRGFLLHYGLDIVLPLFLALLTYILLVGGNSEAWGWSNFRGNAREITRNNPLFWFWHSMLGLQAETAYRFSMATFQFLVNGVPLVLCFLFYGRPVRFGLGVGAILLANGLYTQNKEAESWTQYSSGWVRHRTLYQTRSYFGVLRVQQQTDLAKDKETVEEDYTYLMHGTTHHGLNYHVPKMYERLATTYYHKNGPVGVMMRLLYEYNPRLGNKTTRRFEPSGANWNTYPNDTSVPTLVLGNTLGAQAALHNVMGALPAALSTWGEPAYATVGLGTGTMASYGRPYQTVHFYEIDDTIRSFSLSDFVWPDGHIGPWFTYLRNALNRGVNIQVLMGDARLRMAQPWVPSDKENEKPWNIDISERGGPESFYQCIELDAFSSDAIPVHLITKEAIRMYFKKLRPDGVLFVHTSNRHVDLVSPVTDVASSLGLKWRVGKDRYDRSSPSEPSNRGRFGSEYVMLAREDKYLPEDNLPKETRDEKGYFIGVPPGLQQELPILWWYTPRAPGHRVWTDDYSDLLSVFRWGFE